MTDTTLAAAPVDHPLEWTPGAVEVGGRAVRYHSAGHGAVLLVIDNGAAAPAVESRAIALLAADHRVVAPELSAEAGAADSPRELGAAVAAFAAALDLGAAAVLGAGAGAAAALWAAIDNPGLVTTLVLEAPTVFGDAAAADPQLVDAMPACEVPTLVLLGQLDPVASPRFAADYKRLPASSVALVYAAGADIKGERPEAFVATVSDYLRRGQAFVLSDKSTLIHP